jgi:hypothetical protein
MLRSEQVVALVLRRTPVDRYLGGFQLGIDLVGGLVSHLWKYADDASDADQKGLRQNRISGQLALTLGAGARVPCPATKSGSLVDWSKTGWMKKRARTVGGPCCGHSFTCVLAPARFATSLTSAVHRGCQNLYVRSTSAKVMAHWTASRCLNIPTDSVVHLSLPLILSAVDSARALL